MMREQLPAVAKPALVSDLLWELQREHEIIGRSLGPAWMTFSDGMA